VSFFLKEDVKKRILHWGIEISKNECSNGVSFFFHERKLENRKRLTISHVRSSSSSGGGTRHEKKSKTVPISVVFNKKRYEQKNNFRQKIILSKKITSNICEKMIALTP
jgi:hypothetical protein